MACEEQRAIEREARARWEAAHQEYDEVVAPLKGSPGTAVAVTEAELREVQEAADRGTAAHTAWIEALKPWLECMAAELARRR